MSTTWQKPAWCGRSCFHVLLLMGALTMCSTGANAQEEEERQLIAKEGGGGGGGAPTGCCWRGLTGGCFSTTEADCSGPCDTWFGANSSCPIICPPLDPVACCLPGFTCSNTPACNCTALGGTPQAAGSACGDPGTCPICLDAGTKGCWGNVLSFDVNSVNMVALKTGKVLISHQSFASDACPAPPGSPTGRCYQLFDPATDTVGARLNVGTDHNLYCAGFNQLADGRVLWVGSVIGDDLSATSIYDPDLGQWSAQQEGLSPRFYPTVKTMLNGKMLVIGGSLSNSCPSVPDIDVFDADQLVGSQWARLTNASFQAPPNDFELGVYPRMEGLSDGSFMYTGSPFVDLCNLPASDRFTRVLDPVLELWTQPFAQQDAIAGGPGLMFEKDMMMKANGGIRPGFATDDVYVLDTTVPNTAWLEVASMNNPRRESFLIALPDGQIAVVGGKTFPGGAEVPEAELYNPAGGFGMGNTWTLGAAAETGHDRGEHSSSVLLVDARILIAGHDLTGQVYSPPNLFNADDSLADRPIITDVTGAGTNLIRYGEAFSMTATFPAGQASGSVRLIRLGASTHSLDQGQQSMALDFTPECCNPNAKPGVGGIPACIEGTTCCDDGLWTCNAGDGSTICATVCPTLKAAAPLHPAEAPPGYYYLFLMSSRGVPSEAAIVQLEVCP